MENTNTNFADMNLAPEITQALWEYNSTINSALDAMQKLESISITAHLAEMFWVKEESTAQVIKEDYLVAA